jgi:hypothetical protein
MAEYKLADLFEEVTIDLGDAKFKLKERTRALGEKVDDVEDKFIEIQGKDDATSDDLAVVIIDMLDMVLEPLGNGENGTRTHAKTVLSRAWKADKIGLDRLLGLLGFCRDKMVGQQDVDPTSALENEG